MTIEHNDIEFHCVKFEERKRVIRVATANDPIRYVVILQINYH